MPQTKQSKRILLVDDEKPLRRAMKRALEFDGHVVLEAADGEQALELFNLVRFDLVITDLLMPGLKGDELAAKIKRTSPAQRIILITATPDRVDAQLPFEKIVVKPFTLEVFRASVSEAIEM